SKLLRAKSARRRNFNLRRPLSRKVLIMRMTQANLMGALFYLLTAGGLTLAAQNAALPPGAQAPAQAVQERGSATETQSLHIMAGRSVVINLQARLRRVLVSNPAVIEAVTTDPTQVVVTAKAAGSSSLILWDEAGQSRIIEVYADVDVSGLRDAIQQAY